jgi:hypothetical protein
MIRQVTDRMGFRVVDTATPTMARHSSHVDDMTEQLSLLTGPGRSYQTYASFSDPDGNGWLFQEIRTRLPGRTWEE